MKSFLNKKEINPEEIPSLEVNGKIIYSDKEKANALNSFFIEQSTLTEDDNELPDIVPLDCELQELIIYETEVNNVIKNLDPTKAVGPDLIHNKLLIANRNIIAPVLAKIFNKCLNKNKFPSTWKIAHANPVYKTGAKKSCSNYRPISLLSCVGKVFERCIHKHVYDFIKAHIITPLQSGFIPGDSTVNQLLSTYHELCTSFDKGITTQVVYLDISKAFDRVWHQGLLLKLKAAGIRGKLFEISKDYLSNRYQSVVIKGQKSDLKCIPAGVPQGSVLGPLLFLIYINDIVNEIESTIKLFADDTSLSLALNDPDIRAEILNSDSDKIKNWVIKWKVKFNEDKTDLLNITRDCNHILQLTFGTKNLKPSQSHKHLGLIV